MNITIDKEFRGLIPPLTAEEYAGLEKSILEEGCRDALITWNGVLVDGHNRYEICQKHGMTFRTQEKAFDSREDAIDWIIDNQLNRRNLNDSQRRYLMGKQYERMKKRQGGRSDRTFGEGKNSTPKTAEKLAEAYKVNEKTVRDNGKYAKAIDTIAENHGDAVKNMVLSGNIDITKNDTCRISEMPIDEQHQMVEKIMSGEAQKAKSISAVIKAVEKQEKINQRLPKIRENPDIQLFNANCMEILKKIPDNSIDMVLTDPPYAVDFKPSWSGDKWKEKLSSDDTLILIDNACEELKRICKADAHLYFFTGWVMYPDFCSVISRHFDISNLIVWEKNNTSLVDFDKRYAFKHEFIVFAKQKGNNDRVLINPQSPDVLHYDRVNNPSHSCEKPVDLLEYLIKNSTIEGETVLDCFMGSGNTGVASTKNSRKYIGIEIEKNIFDSAKSSIYGVTDYNSC